METYPRPGLSDFSLLLEKSLGATTMENCMEVIKKTKKLSFHMIQQSHSWTRIQRKLKLEQIQARHSSATLFAVTKTWKQFKCPLKEERIKKL